MYLNMHSSRIAERRGALDFRVPDWFGALFVYVTARIHVHNSFFTLMMMMMSDGAMTVARVGSKNNSLI